MDLFYLFLSFLDVGSLAGFNKSLHYEGLEQLERHFLRKTALVNLEVRTDDDNGTAGVVDTFAEKVLTEASLLTSEHFGEGFERTVGGTCNRLAASAVVDERVYCFLEHTLFVADDDVRRVKLHQSLKSVVTVDNTSVEVVEVGSRESAAVELYHRTDFRRDYGNYVENHPLGFVA